MRLSPWSRWQHHATSHVAGRQPRVDTSPCRGWRWSQHQHHYSTTGPPRRRHPADGAPAPGTLPVAGQQSPARRRGAHMVTAAHQLPTTSTSTSDTCTGGTRGQHSRHTCRSAEQRSAWLPCLAATRRHYITAPVQCGGEEKYSFECKQ